MALPFVGRKRELEGLKRLNAEQQYLPIVVYGPEGCGKTTLFREAVSRFDRWFDDGRAVYVDAMAKEPHEVLSVTGAASADIVNDVVTAISRLLPDIASHIVGIAGRFFANHIATAVDRLLARFGPRRVMAVVDEAVQSLGLASVEGYVKYLESRMNVNRPEEWRGKIVNFFVLTSEGESWERLMNHTYLVRMYLWNLPRDDFEELYERAKELYRPANPPPFDDVWRVCGGNPRCLERVARLGFDVEAYMRELLKPDFRVARAFAELEGMGRLDVLSAAVEDVDVLWRAGLEVERVFVRHNLAMIVPRDEDPRYSSAIGGVDPPVDSEIGVGRIYAWQLPAYREAFRRLLGERR